MTPETIATLVRLFYDGIHIQDIIHKSGYSESSVISAFRSVGIKKPATLYLYARHRKLVDCFATKLDYDIAKELGLSINTVHNQRLAHDRGACQLCERIQGMDLPEWRPGSTYTRRQPKQQMQKTASKMITIVDLLRDSLQQNGYDGLYNPGLCGCENDDLAPCDDHLCSDCLPGYMHTHTKLHEWVISGQKEPMSDDQIQEILEGY